MAVKVLAAAGQSGAGPRRQGFGDGDLRHLESDVTAVAHDLRSKLDQLLANSANVGLWLQADFGWAENYVCFAPERGRS